MTDFVMNLISSYGYIGMFIGMVLEAVIIAIPSEFILATGGILASKGIFTFTGAFITGLLGSVFCAIVIYLMGYFGGKPFVKKYGKYFFTLISLPIGIMRLSFIKFIIYTTIGSIPWTLLFVYVGYKLGENWIILNTIVNYFKVPIRIILVLIIIGFIYKKIKTMLK